MFHFLFIFYLIVFVFYVCFSVQVAIIKLFQRKPLKENELGTLQESVRQVAQTNNLISPV